MGTARLPGHLVGSKPLERHHGWSIRKRLMLVALAVALPLLLLLAGIIWQLAENERDNRRQAIVFSTRVLMNAADALLTKQIAIAQLLATSPALQSGDLETFRQEAERARAGLSGGWIVVSTQDGQQIINLVRLPGSPLPRRNPTAVELMQKAIATRQTQISNVITGAILAGPIIAIEVPVIRDGKPPLGLAVITDTRAFVSLLEERNLPEGWLAGIIDRDGKFIARSREHDRFVGQLASEGFRAVARRSKEGWNEFRSIEGITIANGHATSDLSGWVMGLAAEESVFYEPILRTILIASFAGLAAILLSVALAIWAARRIAGPIEAIEHGTRALLLRKPVELPKTGVSEVDRALDAFNATAGALDLHEKDRDEREAHVRLIMRELSHRSKNLLAIVLAIARQTSRHAKSFEEFEQRFNARIQALADAHDLLVEQQWVGAALEDLVRGQLSAFGMEKVITRGEPIILRAEAVQNVALALHELATNASKYGSLSVADGKVSIDWTLHGGGDGKERLRLTWREIGGPPVAPPTRNGFGRLVLERVTVNALGTGTLEFSGTGVVWTCEIDDNHIVRPTSKAAA